MITIGITLFIFSELLFYIVILDVILSWLALIGINYRPNFLKQIIDPIYSFINKHIPTTFGMFRFDALIVILFIYLFQYILLITIPGLQNEILRLTNSI